jgi:hypothetical protein
VVTANDMEIRRGKSAGLWRIFLEAPQPMIYDPNIVKKAAISNC